MNDSRRGAVFVLPPASTRQQPPIAALITTAGWAAGAKHVLGDAWIATSRGACTIDEARTMATKGHDDGRRQGGVRGVLRHVLPNGVRLCLNDCDRVGRAMLSSGSALHGPWQDAGLAFVWQRHHLMPSSGFRLARRMGVPLVLSVHSLVEEEAESWGVSKGLRGRIVERLAEVPFLQKADLLACVSQELVRDVVDRGVSPERVIVTPNGVDTSVMKPLSEAERLELRRTMQVEDMFVITWVGSFRPFHALDLLVDAAASLPGVERVVLLLVGDGDERHRIEARTRELGVKAIFPGLVSQAEVARLLGASDAAVLPVRGHEEYHYSPVKLREYMACGLPVVAGAAGELGRWLKDGTDALLTVPGDARSMAERLALLQDDAGLRQRLGEAAHAKALSEASWASRVEQVVAALAELDGRLRARRTT